MNNIDVFRKDGFDRVMVIIRGQDCTTPGIYYALAKTTEDMLSVFRKLKKRLGHFGDGLVFDISKDVENLPIPVVIHRGKWNEFSSYEPMEKERVVSLLKGLKELKA